MTRETELRAWRDSSERFVAALVEDVASEFLHGGREIWPKHLSDQLYAGGIYQESHPVYKVRAMPGTTAKRGDVYNVDPNATMERDRKSSLRRMVCVAELPSESTWRAMARITTRGRPEDLPSPRRDNLGLTSDGWWTYRFLRSVKKRWTGQPRVCEYVSSLPERLRGEVLAHYMSRPRPKK